MCLDVEWGCKKLDLFKMWCTPVCADSTCRQISVFKASFSRLIIVLLQSSSAPQNYHWGSQHKWPVILKCSSLLGTSRDCNCKEFLPEICGSGIIKSWVPHSWLQLSYLVICLCKEEHFFIKFCEILVMLFYDLHWIKGNSFSWLIIKWFSHGRLKH